MKVLRHGFELGRQRWVGGHHKGLGQGQCHLGPRPEQVGKIFCGKGQDKTFCPPRKRKTMHMFARDVDDRRRLKTAALTIQSQLDLPALQKKDLMQMNMAVGRNRPVKACRAVHDPLDMQHIGKGPMLSIKLP